MQVLNRKGILRSYKGKGGGFKLKKYPFKTGRDYVSRDAVEILWKESTGKPFEYALEHAFVGKHVSTEKRYLHGVHHYLWGAGKPKLKLYADQLVGRYEKVAETVKTHGIKNIVLDKYRIALSPLPRKEHAFPTPHREAKGYPLYLMTYKRINRNQAGNTAQNPILNRLGDTDENFVLINTATAIKTGIANDDQVRIETRVGSAQGKARLTEGIRPDVIGVSYHYGHFSPGFPDYAKKGIWINSALEQHPDLVSGMNSFNDTKCKVTKV